MRCDNYCNICDFYDDCEYAGDICFCDNCAARENCRLRDGVVCLAGYGIECNNGYEEESDLFDYEEE